MNESTSLAERFEADHRECDRLWDAVEVARDLAALRRAWGRFDGAMREHLRLEEEVLFPVLDAKLPRGPTTVMRDEHERMRRMLDRMADHVRRGDRDVLLDDGDTLALLVSQHNVKEETMLYPTAERVLRDAWPAIRALLPESLIAESA